MASSFRLTNSMRSDIVYRAVQSSGFDKRMEVLKSQEEDLAERCYNALVSQEDQDLLSKIAEKWIKFQRSLVFNANGWTIQFYDLKRKYPVPEGWYYNQSLGILTGELADEAQAFVQAQQTIREERVECCKKLHGFISRFNTLKQLQKEWPEGSAFYQHFIDERQNKVDLNLPAVVIEDINKLLGLAKLTPVVENLNQT